MDVASIVRKAIENEEFAKEYRLWHAMHRL